MRVLVTRPEADAGPLVAALAARGHEVLRQPLFEIQAISDPEPLDVAAFQALLFTSANGVRAFASLSADRSRPVFTVGDASADTAKSAGFPQVVSADGKVEDLAELVAAQLNPAAGPLFQCAARDLAGDLKTLLEARGFTIERRILYRAEAVQALRPEVAAALRRNELEVVLFFSPRSAASFLGLIEDHGLTDACQALWALCLSPAVATVLEGSTWAGLRIAEQPRQDALLKSLDVLAVSSMIDPREDG